MTLFDLVDRSAASIDFDDGDTWTGPELADQARRVAAWLANQGVERGDRVALRLPNGADWVRILIGCAVGGFVAVAVNTRYSDDEAADLVRRSGARVLDFGSEFEVGWRRCPPASVTGGRDDPVVVFTTSGTTSKPKMVLHHHASLVDHAHDVARHFGHTVDDVALVAMPLCGTFGLTSFTGALAGPGRVVVTNFEVASTSALIERARVTCVNGSDDMFHRLLEHGGDLSSIRLGGYARFNTSLDGVVERAESAGATLTGLYGMSEVQALFGLRDAAGGVDARTRAGGTLTSPRARYRVVDGELQVRGPSLFAGYLAEGGASVDAELTARHHDDGWFRTGDLAEAENDRTFEYLTRLGDSLRLGGFLVSPAEIESVLMEFHGVDATQVVAVDRPTGARPVAFVIAPDGVDEPAVIAHCGERLARFKVPIRVVVLDEFPTTPSANGTKIQKSKLRDIAAASLQTN